MSDQKISGLQGTLTIGDGELGSPEVVNAVWEVGDQQIYPTNEWGLNIQPSPDLVKELLKRIEVLEKEVALIQVEALRRNLSEPEKNHG